MGCGEGKSKVIALCGIILALWGFEVTCIQQNEYQCQREAQEYSSLFSYVKVQEKIHYKTLEKACKEAIESSFGCLYQQLNLGTIQEAYKSLILKPIYPNFSVSQQKPQNIPKAMLIENIESLCDEEFLDHQYEPEIRIQNNDVFYYFSYLWDNKHEFIEKGWWQRISNFFSMNKDKTQIENFQNQFNPNFQDLSEKIGQKIIKDLKKYNYPIFKVENGKVCYFENNKQQISKNQQYGYKTTFANFEALKNNFNGHQQLFKQVQIILKCGKFNLNKIPSQFSLVIGVASNASKLNQIQKKILMDKYRILNYTQIPKIFKDQIKNINNENYITISQDQSKQIQQISQQIQKEINKRSHIVVFKNLEILKKFQEKCELNHLNQFRQLINEKTSDQLTAIIQNGGLQRKLILTTKEFAMGTDFKCRDDVASNGGFHLIQTFFSKTLTEEYNIRGLISRYNQEGTYSMILCQQDLETQFNYNQQQSLKYGQIYKYLEDLRQNIEKQSQNIEIIQNQEQSIAEEMKQNVFEQIHLNNAEPKFSENIKKFLIQENFSELQTKEFDGYLKSVNSIILLEATKQMEKYDLINKMKKIMEQVISSCQKELSVNFQKNKPTLSFQIVVFRNYDQKKQKVIEASQWYSKSEQLTQFLNKQRNLETVAFNEAAIELGLDHAIQESGRLQAHGKHLSQIILIGESAPNNKSIDAYIMKRPNLRIIPDIVKAPYYEDELKNELFEEVPVHAFYLDNKCKNSYYQLANKGKKGTSEYIDTQKIGIKLHEILYQRIVKLTLIKTAELNMDQKTYNEYKKKYEKTLVEEHLPLMD